MGFPKVGTVRHVIITAEIDGDGYWVTWEQFRMEQYKSARWTKEAKKLETWEEAEAFSFSL